MYKMCNETLKQLSTDYQIEIPLMYPCERGYSAFPLAFVSKFTTFLFIVMLNADITSCRYKRI